VSIYDADEAQTGASDAAVAYKQAIDVLRQIGNETALGKALAAYGRYKVETGATTAGRDMLKDAVTLFSKLGLDRQVEQVEKLLATLK
jgi:hypothetical protein